MHLIKQTKRADLSVFMISFGQKTASTANERCIINQNRFTLSKAWLVNETKTIQWNKRKALNPPGGTLSKILH